MHDSNVNVRVSMKFPTNLDIYYEGQGSKIRNHELGNYANQSNEADAQNQVARTTETEQIMRNSYATPQLEQLCRWTKELGWQNKKTKLHNMCQPEQ